MNRNNRCVKQTRKWPCCRYARGNASRQVHAPGARCVFLLISVLQIAHTAFNSSTMSKVCLSTSYFICRWFSLSVDRATSKKVSIKVIMTML